MSKAPDARVLAVVVVHGRALDRVEPWPFLCDAMARVTPWLRGVLIYDNSAQAALAAQALPAWAQHVHDAANGGTAAAYGTAIVVARRAGCDWLLLLDHDTRLPSDFTHEAGDALARAQLCTAALLPRVRHAGRPISPATLTAWGRVCPLALDAAAPPRARLTGIASGALVRCNALEAAGPLPPELWLDYVDHWLFARMQAQGATIGVIDIVLDHDLSILRPAALDPRRWRSVLHGEALFVATLARPARALYPLRLALRALRLAGGGQLRLAAIVGARLVGRARAAAHGDVRAAMPDTVTAASVVLAAYNGERFIEQQLRSVLEQLAPDDELIVIDDASTDATPQRIASCSDPRLRCLRNDHNLGVRGAFERGLHEARHPLVFLCDQDDVWLPGKREAFVQAFAQRPRATLAVSDAWVIDEDGRRTASSFMATKGGFRHGFWANLLRNRYLGCAMAVRRSVLDQALPIPPQVPQHDMWIGSIAALRGEVVYLPQPLLAYRRHANNLSPNTPQALASMLRWRWTLAAAVLRRRRGTG